MCDPLTLAIGTMAAGSVLQAGASVQEGNQRRDLAEAEAQVRQRQADQERDAAVAQAEKFRRAGRKQSASARAAYAASGVSVGIGTPVRINETIERDAEEDAYMNILTGKRRGETLDTEAALTRQAGRNAQTAGRVGVVTSLLSGASQIGLWKSKG